MLFGRLRTPFERVLAREPRDRFESGFHVAAVPSPAGGAVRGDSPRGPLSLVQPPRAESEDEFAGLDRLDREELDED